MDKLAVSPAELFLHIALTSTNRNTRKRVPHVALILTHRDAAAAVSLANPATLMTSISRCCYRRDLFELGHSLVALTFFGDPITWLVGKMGNWTTSFRPSTGARLFYRNSVAIYRCLIQHTTLRHFSQRRVAFLVLVIQGIVAPRTVRPLGKSAMIAVSCLFAPLFWRLPIPPPIACTTAMVLSGAHRL